LKIITNKKTKFLSVGLIRWALENMHYHDNNKEYSPTEDDIKRLMGEK